MSRLIWKIIIRLHIDIILYIIFKAFTDMYLARARARVYALSIERPTSRDTCTGRGIKMSASL